MYGNCVARGDRCNWSPPVSSILCCCCRRRVGRTYERFTVPRVWPFWGCDYCPSLLSIGHSSVWQTLLDLSVQAEVSLRLSYIGKAFAREHAIKDRSTMPFSRCENNTWLRNHKASVLIMLIVVVVVVSWSLMPNKKMANTYLRLIWEKEKRLNMWSFYRKLIMFPYTVDTGEVFVFWFLSPFGGGNILCLERPLRIGHWLRLFCNRLDIQPL